MLDFKKVHFVGVGGIGMSALARILLDMGVEVSGSDLVESSNLATLKKLGAYVYAPHNADLMPNDLDLLVYSSAIPEDNPEVVKGKKLGIPCIRRGELLAKIVNEKFSVLVAGSHGKTTTTSMMAKIAFDAGLHPTVIVGGKIKDLKDTNAYLGSGKLVIAETDESDGTFLLLKPSMCVVTNIDKEHLNFYGGFEPLKRAFREFLENTKGLRLVFKDDEVLDSISSHLDRITYSLKDKTSDIFVEDVKMGSYGSRFRVNTPWGNYSISILLPGIHNVQNATAAFSAMLALGVGEEKAIKSLEEFSGVERRLTIRGELNGIVVVDDYAHHPTEILNTLRAVKLKWPGKRIIAVFQPHRFSRIKYLWKDFAGVFKDADVVWITDIYAAGEKENDFEIGKLVTEISKVSGKDVFYVSHWEDMVYPILRILDGNDVVITLGAGDIWKFCHRLLESMV